MLVALAGADTGFAQDVPAKLDDRPKITVTGEAVVNVKPDRIVLSFGIETSDQAIAAARQKNADAFKKAVAAIKECGIPEKDIQTDHLSIEPRYKDGYRGGAFLGYFVSNTVAVISNSPEKLEDLVTKLLEAGVSHIHGIEFQTTEFKKHREQAREMALKAAKEKAEKMAAVSATAGTTQGVAAACRRTRSRTSMPAPVRRPTPSRSARFQSERPSV
jgi:uncharacterized protein YggE